MKKNVKVVATEYGNCWEHGVEICAYTHKEQKAPKKDWMSIACCPKIKSKCFSLHTLDEEIDIDDEDYGYLKRDLVDSYIEEYCEENGIDYSTISISYYLA